MTPRYDARILSYKEAVLQLKDTRLIGEAGVKIIYRDVVKECIESPELIMKRFDTRWVSSPADMYELLSIFHRAEQDYNR